MAYKIEKNGEIIIDGWEKGITSSPYSGINDARAVNVSDIPGVVFASTRTKNERLNATQETEYLGVSRTFTANDTTGIITLSSVVTWEYTAVTFTTTGTLPSGLSTGTTYYLRDSGGTNTTYKVSASLKDAVNAIYINITSTGSGTHTVTSIDINQIRNTAKDPRSGSIYAIDYNQRVWCSNVPGGSAGWVLLDGNTLTNGYGGGIAVWQDYLFAFRGSSIDVYGPLSNPSTRVWSNSWQSLNATLTYTTARKTLVMSNNILYWTDYNDAASGRTPGYIGSLALATTSAFNPASSGTYSYNSQALDLPDGDEPVALTELNGQLIIATNNASVYSKGINSKLYYWDTINPSFNGPLNIPEAPIADICNANNIIYIFCGYRGRVYKTNLAVVAEAFKIPDHMYYPSSSSVGYEGLPLSGYVGQGLTSNTANSSTYYIKFGFSVRVTRRKIVFVVNLYGSTALWSYDIYSNLLQIDAKPTNGYGSSSTDSTALMGVETYSPNVSDATASPTKILFYGMYYNSGTTTYTLDAYDPISNGSTSSSYYDTYNGSITSDYIQTGITNNKRTFEQLEYILDRDMIEGSGLKIYYRTKRGTAFTLLSTEDYSTFGATLSRVVSFPVSDTGFLQIKIELNRNTLLRQIRIR